MLHINKPFLPTESTRPLREMVSLAKSEFVSPSDLYAGLVGFVRRQLSVIIFVLLLSLALGTAYLFTSAPRFTGQAVLVIDTHKGQFLQPASIFSESQVDPAMVETQIAILSSQEIALSVVKDLHLDEDREFVSPNAGFIGAIVGLIANAIDAVIPSKNDKTIEPSANYKLTQRALSVFQSRLKIQRVGITYAIEIDFQSLNPDRAAQLANAVADAYINDTLEAKYQVTRRAGIWLQDRLRELRGQSSDAERAVVDYKGENKIVDTGGQLMNEQQIAELNSALIQAQAATAEAKARFDRVQRILAGGDVDPAGTTAATVTDTLHNEVITKLREQYLDYAAKASDWTVKYGAKHLAVINLRNQMNELRHSIYQELQRTAETYKSDFEIASARQESIQSAVEKTVSEAQTTNQARVTLHNLESSAQTYRALYDNFLQRYMETVQQQSFPISEARVITRATRPLGKSSPRSFYVLTVASLGGLILGACLGAFREISDRVFRTAGQVSELLHADCISLIPIIKNGTVASSSEAESGPARRSRKRSIKRTTGLPWMVVDTPLSRFTESIRAIKIALDLSSATKTHKILGITSSLPDEGKSTIAVSLAQLIAHGGGRALLVDCDLRKPSLSRSLAPGAKAGIIELIAGKATLDEVVWTDPTTGLSFLPAVIRSRLTHTAEILSSDATRALFESFRDSYDYVIVDLSPLAPIVDVRVMPQLTDCFLFVVEWGRTRLDVVEHALNDARGVHDNLLGVVLNKTNMSTFARYDLHGGSYYDSRYYGHYGYDDSGKRN